MTGRTLSRLRSPSSTKFSILLRLITVQYYCVCTHTRYLYRVVPRCTHRLTNRWCVHTQGALPGVYTHVYCAFARCSSQKARARKLRIAARLPAASRATTLAASVLAHRTTEPAGMPPLLLHAAVIAALLLASANAHGVLLSPRAREGMAEGIGAKISPYPTGLLTQGVPGVPPDPFAPRRGPLDPLHIGKVP
jgi:hypothetical protein